MSEQEGNVEAIRAIAEEALRLSDEVLAGLSKGEVFGGSPPPPGARQDPRVGDPVGQGKTRDEAERDMDHKLVCLMMLVLAGTFSDHCCSSKGPGRWSP